MYRVAVLAICIAMACTAQGQMLGGGSLMETMLLSQMFSANNNQNKGTPGTPGAVGSRAGARGLLGGGGAGSQANKNNPLASMFGGAGAGAGGMFGGAGAGAGGMFGNMGRLMMLSGK